VEGAAVVAVAFVVLLAALVFGVASAAARSPAAAWSVRQTTRPSVLSFADNLNSGCEIADTDGTYHACDRFSVVVTNVGTLSTSGEVTVTDTLPEGLTLAKEALGETEVGPPRWQCPFEGVEQRVVTCTLKKPVAALSAAAVIEMPVTVSPTAAVGSVEGEVTVSGGGAGEVTQKTKAVVGSPSEVAPALPFGPLGMSFEMLSGGVPDSQAAGHPAAFTTAFSFPSVDSNDSFRHGEPYPFRLPWPVENVKQIITDLPAGVIGDALSTPMCSLSQVLELTPAETECPATTRIGTLVVLETGAPVFNELAIFNVTPEYGHAAQFAVYLPTLNHAVMLYASLVGTGANAHARVTGIQPDALSLEGVSAVFYGDPAEHFNRSHELCTFSINHNGNFNNSECSEPSSPGEGRYELVPGSSLPEVAFATDPSDCAAKGFTAKMYVDTWQHPGRLLPDGEPDLSDPNWKSSGPGEGESPPVTGCEGLQFDPSLTLAPEASHSQADEPSGYESVLRVPQNEDPRGLATPPVKSVTATLPAGVAISPAAANGLVGCTLGGEGIGLESEAEANQPGHCPRASAVGTVKLSTPLLKEELEGSVFVAEPTCSPCSEAQAEKGEVFALYVEVGSGNSGIHIKQKGIVEVGGTGANTAHEGLPRLAAGQIRTRFAVLPQEPFSELRLKFNSGPGAPLANPQSCGIFTGSGVLESWAHEPAPGEAHGTANVLEDPSFSITGNCENGFAPSFTAGTVNPQAGAFSAFTLTIARKDGEQDLSGLTVAMPKALTGKITGIAECPEPAASQGTCATVAPGSRIGSATAAAGSGPDPYWQSGSVYLTGPYNGGPFGLSVVVPAVAGPFNLGNIIVRASIRINPETAQDTVVSDPLPQSVDGVPLRVKEINVTIGENNNFTFNPTSCEPTKVTGTITGAQGTSTEPSSPFQAAGCDALKFTPTVTISAAGHASKTDGESLGFKIAYPAGALGTQAWFRELKVVIPSQLPSRQTTLEQSCLAATFDANPAGCPAHSKIGEAVVHTQLLPVPLTGPLYFVSYGAAKFPSVVMLLSGDNVNLRLTGETLIKNGVTSVTFPSIPGVPFETAEVTAPAGEYSEFGANLGVGNYDYCGQKLTTTTELQAANGLQINQNTPITITGCPTRFSIRHTSVNTKKHTITLTIYTPAAGKLTATGKGLHTRTKIIHGQELTTITLTPTHNKPLTTRIKLTYTPTRGKTQTTSTTTHIDK
jgi:hypothetical protein